VHWHPEVDGPGFWAITRYDDIHRISRQPHLFRSRRDAGRSDEMDLAAQRQMMLSMDPPQHERFKLLVSRGLTPKKAPHVRH
jgi:cholest-4-en-3-one 26-monooxygenase